MLGIKTQPESEQQAVLKKQLLLEKFPTQNSDRMYSVLQLYDEAYIITREYFAFYYVMGTETVTEYVNSHEIGFSWEFLKNAVFDMGINSLFRFYDKPNGKNNSKNEHILWQCEQALGVKISSLKSSLIAEITKYRHNNTAHCGKGFHTDSTNIKYDSPLIAIEKLRQDRNEFDKERLDSASTLYLETLYEYFYSKIHGITKVLNSSKIDGVRIAHELKEYMSDALNSKVEAQKRDKTSLI